MEDSLEADALSASIPNSGAVHESVLVVGSEHVFASVTDYTWNLIQ